ncbi:ABC transporter permease, partial [Staphylococcus sp. SIMBA_130]
MQKHKKIINLLLGSGILLAFIGILIVSFFYTPYDVNSMDIPNKLKEPSTTHIFGTDEFGRDIFSRILK